MRRAVPLLLLLVAAPAAARVVGWPDHPAVRAAIDATRAEVASCVEDYRTSDAAASLRFAVQLRVRSDGSIAAVTFDRETPLGAGQRYCLRRTLAGLRLVPPRAEQRLPVFYAVDLPPRRSR